MRGGRLSFRSSAAAADPSRRLQFTLGRLFGWLTASAIVLSAVKSVVGLWKVRTGDFDWWGILILGLVSAAIGLVFGWVLLGTRTVRAIGRGSCHRDSSHRGRRLCLLRGR
jgi:hypothetical protein